MKGKCRECGCTANNACYHPNYGTCWWVDDTDELCSYCSIEELKSSPEVIRPVPEKNDVFLIIDGSALKSFVQQKNLLKRIRSQNQNTIIDFNRLRRVGLTKEDIERLKRIELNKKKNQN